MSKSLLPMILPCCSTPQAVRVFKAVAHPLPGASAGERGVGCAVITRALLNAGKALGRSQTDLGVIIGKDHTSISRGLDPQTKSGEPAPF